MQLELDLVFTAYFVPQVSGLYEYKIMGSISDVLPDVCKQVYMDLEYRKNWDDYVYGKLAMGKSKYWSEASLTENYNKIPQMLIPIYKGPKEMSHWTKPPPLNLVLQVQIPTSVNKMRASESCEPCSPLKNHWKKLP